MLNLIKNITLSSKLFFFIFLFILSAKTFAFSCMTSAGPIYDGGGSANVYVNLAPQLSSGQVLVVNLGDSISCRNDDPANFWDYARIEAGSSYSGVLNSFHGTLSYYGTSYNLPLSSPTSYFQYTWGQYQPLNLMMYLTPIGNNVSGTSIKQGDLITVLNLFKQAYYSTGSGAGHSSGNTSMTWYIYANNNTVVPTGGCDVSSRNVIVNLPDYPGSMTPVPLTVSCLQSQKLSYYISGAVANTGNNIFSNTASSSSAQGVGIEISNANGVLSTGSNVSLGTVGASAVDLGLKANYALTGGQVIAGNVQSLIGVTFIYQ
ncbi:fimbrial protein FimH [Raoultella planticola]|uniref:Fimbrial protein n=1 Tax=Klebsiella electrica TaxID=1259973 RepID=A0AAJ5QRR9_9ENTR|nr:fimbrial protein [Klebsiella electrica]WBW60400.1 fimbrial protein [Klebsiella electrica]BBV77921.1 fimbrial protein FimH [Raoultella planticola]